MNILPNKGSFKKGHKPSIGVLKRMSESHKGQISGMKGKKQSAEARGKISRAKLRLYANKNNHPRWKGGVSRDNHGGKDNIIWRSKVFERDNWTCQTCGIRGVYLEAHHIKGWAKYQELRYEVDNGVTLCVNCHSLTDNYKGKGSKKYE